MEPEKLPIQLPSEAVRDLISHRPHWWVRWGMTLFLGILLLGLFASWLIHYPEKVNAPLRIVSVHAPKPVLAKASGRLVRLLVRNGQRVVAGQSLAFLESTADHQQVLALAAYGEALARQRLQNAHVEVPTIQSFTRLGELQPAYERFQQAYRQYVSLGTNGYYAQRKQLLTQELADLAALEKNLLAQLRIQDQDLQIAEEEYTLQQELAAQKVIAPLELRREKSKWLARQLPVQQTQALLFQNRSTQSGKRKELLELTRTLAEGESIFVESLNSLRSRLDAWQNRYIITAPITGRVVYTALLEENQPLNPQQELCYISPPDQAYYGEVLIPQLNLGKVKVGQSVLVNFAGYPAPEYGYLTGRVIYLASIPNRQNAFLAHVSLPGNGLTHYRKHVVYQTGMGATAEIITEDRRLLEVLFFELRRVTHP